MTSERLANLKLSGFMDTRSIYVENNVYDIPNRLREINPNFFVMFNPDIQKYELHDRSQMVTHTITFPFDELDGRCIDYTRERLVERADILFKQMQEKNAKIEADKKNSFLDNAGEIAKEIYTHAVRHSIDGEIDSGAYKTKFI
jgi:hypothetical protein